MAMNDLVPISEVAKQLGISEETLKVFRLAVCSTKEDKSNIEMLTKSDVDQVEAEIHARTAQLKLDELARLSIESEWLAVSQLKNISTFENVKPDFENIATKIDSLQQGGADSKELDSIRARLEACESAVSKVQSTDTSKIMSLVASLQSMIESQGKTLDSLQSQITDLKKVNSSVNESLAKIQNRHDRLLDALKEAASESNITHLGTAPKAEGAGSAAPKSASVRTEKTETKNSETSPKEPTAELETPRFVNSKQMNPVKYGVVREIEYNFLLERMDYKRLDAYEANFNGEISVPNDDQIKDFLAAFELGCDVEEVEFVTVQRGEYQMIQYKRSQKTAGLKGWMPSKRKMN